MNTLLAWVRAMRLQTLPVSISGVIVGYAFAFHIGDFDTTAAWLCMAVAVLGQIASNFANEYYDYKNGIDEIGREGFRRGVTEGDISPRAMLWATYLTLAATGGCGLALVWIMQSWWYLLIGVFILCFAILYSAGPFPISHLPIGEITVFIFFGIIPVVCTTYAVCHEFLLESVEGGISVGLLAANVLIVNNYRDWDDDRYAEKYTLAVILGPHAMPIIYAINAGLAIWNMWYMWGLYNISTPILVLTVEIIIAVSMYYLKGRKLNPLLAITALALLYYSLIFCYTRS